MNGGFYWSALLLTALPFAIVAVIGAWVRYTLWRGPRRISEMAEPRAIEKR
jgi:hypothetical protein